MAEGPEGLRRANLTLSKVDGRWTATDAGRFDRTGEEIEDLPTTEEPSDD